MGLPVLAIKALTGNGGGADARVDEILKLIPAQATEDNKLTDKDFVNSSISTNTAHYIFKTVGDEKVPFDSVTELEAYSGTVTPNDYAFVAGTDTAGNTYYDRYKATVSGTTVTWAKEYRLNNSSFTAEQWAAISSGITSSLVSKLNNMHGVYVVPYKNRYTADEIRGIQTAYDLGELIVCRVQQGGMASYVTSILYNLYTRTDTYVPQITMDFWMIGSGALELITEAANNYISYKPDGYRYYQETGTGTWSQYFNSNARLYYDSTLTKLANSRLGVNPNVVAMKTDVKAATAFSCEMSDGTTKTLTMNGVLS